MALETQQNLPQQYVTDLGVDYGKQLAGLTSIPLDTDRLAPQVAAQDAAQTQAYNLAGSGVGSYAPYLTQAGAYDTAAAGYSGPQGYESFQSPYQQDIINASLNKFDQQAAKGMTGIGQMAAKSGNLGGGREGVMKGQYQADSDMNRAILESGMLQQGFNQANTNANTAFNQQGQLFGNQQNLMTGANTLGADQQRMASLVPNLYGSDVQTLQGAGTNQQLQAQTVLDQQREANRLAAYEPYERLGYMGAGMGNVMGGAMGQYQSQVTPNQSPLQQAIGIASLGYGAYRGMPGNN